jgi:predicted ATPase
MHLRRVRLFPEKYPTRDHYPFNQEIFLQTRSVEFRSPVTFLVGENGTGKSTLLNALCKRCGIHIWKAPEGSRLRSNPYEKALHLFMAVEWTDRAVPGSFFASEIDPIPRAVHHVPIQGPL